MAGLQEQVGRLMEHIERLETRLAAVEGKVFPKPVESAHKPWAERGVSITRPLSTPPSLPTAEAFDQLLALVREKFPIFKRPASASDADEASFRRSFANAFRGSGIQAC
jgi:hypothetical protein